MVRGGSLFDADHPKSRLTLPPCVPPRRIDDRSIAAFAAVTRRFENPPEPVAAPLQLMRDGAIRPNDTTVAVLTGHGRNATDTIAELLGL